MLVIASTTGIVTKIIIGTIREENDPKPPNRPGGHGGGGGDGGNPGDPSDPGRARQPTGNDNNKPNPETRGDPMILIPQTTLGMPIPLLPSH